MLRYLRLCNVYHRMWNEQFRLECKIGCVETYVSPAVCILYTLHRHKLGIEKWVHSTIIT